MFEACTAPAVVEGFQDTGSVKEPEKAAGLCGGTEGEIWHYVSDQPDFLSRSLRLGTTVLGNSQVAHGRRFSAPSCRFLFYVMSLIGYH